MEERPQDGRGRPRATKPRAVKALRDGLQTTVSAQTERLARLSEEAGCCVLLTHVPTAGDLAPSAGEVLTGDKEQHGTEQHDGFLTEPVLGKSLLLKKPERLEALGRVWLLALLIWRLMERAMRRHVETTGTP